MAQVSENLEDPKVVSQDNLPSKLPEIFKLIILSDRLDDLLRKANVIDLKRVLANRMRRREFSQAAEKFIQRQKGGNL